MIVWSKLIGVLLPVALLILAASPAQAESPQKVTCSDAKLVGCVLTTLDGVDVYFNGWNPVTNWGAYAFGYKWQCVELIQRYYYQKYGYPKIWAPLYAYQAFDKWGHPATMTAYPNGSATAPQRGDVLVFAPTTGNRYGHMALVKSVENNRITFVQQNVYDVGQDSLPIGADNVIASEGNYGRVRGWLHENSGRPLALSDPYLAHEQRFVVSPGAAVQLAIAVNAAYRLELDGKSILAGQGNSTTSWLSLEPGEHNAKLYTDSGNQAWIILSVRPGEPQRSGSRITRS